VSSNKFLERNRIVSGLASSVLVVEASYRSGTSVTAKIALEQEKKVFCIPGSLDNCKSVGTNRLIKQFAQIVISPADILEEFGIDVKEEYSYKQKDIEKIPTEYRKIYNLIQYNPIYINDIAIKSKMDLKELIPQLTMLELNGKITKISGNRYIRSNENDIM